MIGQVAKPNINSYLLVSRKEPSVSDIRAIVAKTEPKNFGRIDLDEDIAVITANGAIFRSEECTCYATLILKYENLPYTDPAGIADKVKHSNALYLKNI